MLPRLLRYFSEPGNQMLPRLPTYYNEPGHICKCYPGYPDNTSDSKESIPGGPVRQVGLSYWPARLHRLAETILGIDSVEPIAWLLKRLQIRALLPQVRIFPPTPCFVHRVHAKPAVFREGTLVPSFVNTEVPSLLSKCSDPQES
jgi:hypothetical protein